MLALIFAFWLVLVGVVPRGRPAEVPAGQPRQAFSQSSPVVPAEFPLPPVPFVVEPTPTTAVPLEPVTTTAPLAAPVVELVPAEKPHGPDVGLPADPLSRAQVLLDSVVPPGWFTSDEIVWSLREGSTTYAYDAPPSIDVGRAHTEDAAKLRFVMAHEWGHLVAFRYGDPTAGFGGPPVGFDSAGQHPAEMWAGCVAEVLVTDYWISTHGLPRCPGPSLEFTRAFLASPPPF